MYNTVLLEPSAAGIMLGRAVDFMALKEKVAAGVTIRESFEKAYELAPTSAYAAFCLGAPPCGHCVGIAQGGAGHRSTQ